VKGVYILWTRWGRSGTQGQFQRTPFGKLQDVVREFKKVFKQKTGVKWEDVKDYVKVPKKYNVKRIGGKITSTSDSKLKFSNADFDFEKLLIPWERIDQIVAMENPVEFLYFIKPLLSENHMIQNVTLNQFSRSLMVLAPQDKPTIDIAIDLLHKLSNILKQ